MGSTEKHTLARFKNKLLFRSACRTAVAPLIALVSLVHHVSSDDACMAALPGLLHFLVAPHDFCAPPFVSMPPCCVLDLTLLPLLRPPFVLCCSRSLLCLLLVQPAGPTSAASKRLHPASASASAPPCIYLHVRVCLRVCSTRQASCCSAGCYLSLSLLCAAMAVEDIDHNFACAPAGLLCNARLATRVLSCPSHFGCCGSCLHFRGVAFRGAVRSSDQSTSEAGPTTASACTSYFSGSACRLSECPFFFRYTRR